MIAIRRVDEVKVDFADVIRRSPVAGEPKAYDLLGKFIAASANTFVGYINGNVACLYGMQPASLLSDKVYLWLLTTETATEHKFIFIRHSQVCIEQVLEDYGTIIGETFVKDTKAVRWLKWLGAQYDRPVGMFAPFYITRESFKGRRHG